MQSDYAVLLYFLSQLAFLYLLFFFMVCLVTKRMIHNKHNLDKICTFMLDNEK